MSEENTVGKITTWSDSQWNQFKYWLEDLLRSETVELIFTKADGSTRTMLATKKSDIILEQSIKLKEQENASIAEVSTNTTIVSSVTKQKSKNLGDGILVWDVEINNWRIVKVKNLINVLTLIIKYDYREIEMFKEY